MNILVRTLLVTGLLTFMPIATQAQLSDFIGDWTSVNLQNDEFIHVEIWEAGPSLKLRIWTMGDRNEKLAGEATVLAYASVPRNSNITYDAVALSAYISDPICETLLVLRRDGPHLRVEAYCRFKSGQGERYDRTNYRTVSTFRRFDR